MARPRGLIWLCSATAAALLGVGCADQAPPRKERPADRAGKQYAAERLPAAGAVARLASPCGSAIGPSPSTSLQGDT